MKKVKVLGPGCTRCVTAAEMVQKEAEKLRVPISIEKVTDYAAIASYGIASTPAIVIDGKVVHAGGLPKTEDLAKWLAASGPKLQSVSVVVLVNSILPVIGHCVLMAIRVDGELISCHS